MQSCDTYWEYGVDMFTDCYNQYRYVDIRLSEQAAETIQGFQQWITNEYTHRYVEGNIFHVLDKTLARKSRSSHEFGL